MRALGMFPIQTLPDNRNLIQGSLQLSRILHLKNGTVYIAGRSQEKASRAIEEIKSANPSSKGRLEFLQVDLADLTTIKKAADEFMSKESSLHVLTNNAGQSANTSRSTLTDQLQAS